MKSPSPERGRRSGGGGVGGGSGRNLASCVVALVCLILIIFIALIIFFTLFRPLNPSLSVTAFRIPSFSLSISNYSSLNFSFTVYFSVHNPNRAASFAHYDSTAQLLLAGNRIGFVLIPVGNIDAGKTQSMSITFAIKSAPLVTGAAGTAVVLENRLRVSGKVKVLPFFTHRADASIYCVVVVGETDGQILHYQC